MRRIRDVNINLKEVAKQANIGSDLTLYSARNSYATYLQKSGIPTASISKALGHTSEKVTQVYLADFGDAELDEGDKVLLYCSDPVY